MMVRADRLERAHSDWRRQIAAAARINATPTGRIPHPPPRLHEAARACAPYTQRSRSRERGGLLALALPGYVA
jgi:hypothetical protein